MTRDIYDYEEDFHGQDRKQWRKERKHAQNNDRSKYKKTDIDQVQKDSFVLDPSLKKGRIISITGEGSWVDAEGHIFLCNLKGYLKKEKNLSKNLIAVGDIVYFAPTSEKEGTIAHIHKRYSFLARTDISGKKEQLIAVNVDQVLIIASVHNPPLKPALIDRYLIAARKGNLHPLIVINKIDLLDALSKDEQLLYREFLRAYEPLGFPILSVSTFEKTGIEALRSLLTGKTSVLSGQSGVGKSSLINAAFGLDLKVGDLAQKTAKGSHTTTTAALVPLAENTYCVDTPGIRSFGIWDLKKEEVIQHFEELAHLSTNCRYKDCTHSTEPGCAVKEALQTGIVSSLRYESFCTLLDEATGKADNRTKRKQEPSE